MSPWSLQIRKGKARGWLYSAKETIEVGFGCGAFAFWMCSLTLAPMTFLCPSCFFFNHSSSSAGLAPLPPPKKQVQQGLPPQRKR